jgi:hypothetical protein
MAGARAPGRAARSPAEELGVDFDATLPVTVQGR